MWMGGSERDSEGERGVRGVGGREWERQLEE